MAGVSDYDRFCEDGPAMTEEEAGTKLATLLNEIEEAGIPVQILSSSGDGYHLSVGDGDVYLMEPPSEGEPWELVLP